MKVVGLGGGIACGKSTVSEWLREQDIPVIDCDQIARDVVRKGTWGYRRVINTFKDVPNLLQGDGEINREVLGALVFTQPDVRRRLNQATHLPILLEIIRRLCTSWIDSYRHPIVVIDMPLLFESGFYKLTKPAILVACRQDSQKARLMLRDGLTEQQALDRINSQMSLERKRKLSTLILDNSQSKEDLKMQVELLIHDLCKSRHLWLHKLLSPVSVVIVGLGWLLGSSRLFT